MQQIASNIYHVYVLFRPDGSPFYVGKGQGKRWKNHTAKRYGVNKHLIRILEQANYDVPVVKIADDLSEEEAFQTERAFIKAIGRVAHGGPLVNLTDGGEGCSGLVHSEETKAALSVVRQESCRTPEWRARVSAWQTGRVQTEEHRQNVSKSLTGITRSAETRAKMSAAKKGNPTGYYGRKEPLTPEHAAAISAGKKGKSNGLEGKKLTPEHKTNCSRARRWVVAKKAAAAEGWGMRA